MTDLDFSIAGPVYGDGDFASNENPSRPSYFLTPARHGQIALDLLTRLHGEETGAFLYERFLAGEVSLTAVMHGFDKDGPFEDERGSCIRGYDTETVHERVKIEVGFHAAAIRISADDWEAIRRPAQREKRMRRRPRLSDVGISLA